MTLLAKVETLCQPVGPSSVWRLSTSNSSWLPSGFQELLRMSFLMVAYLLMIEAHSEEKIYRGNIKQTNWNRFVNLFLLCFSSIYSILWIRTYSCIFKHQLFNNRKHKANKWQNKTKEQPGIHELNVSCLHWKMMNFK